MFHTRFYFFDLLNFCMYLKQPEYFAYFFFFPDSFELWGFSSKMKIYFWFFFSLSSSHCFITVTWLLFHLFTHTHHHRCSLLSPIVHPFTFSPDMANTLTKTVFLIIHFAIFALTFIVNVLSIQNNPFVLRTHIRHQAPKGLVLLICSMCPWYGVFVFVFFSLSSFQPPWFPNHTAFGKNLKPSSSLK